MSTKNKKNKNKCKLSSTLSGKDKGVGAFDSLKDIKENFSELEFMLEAGKSESEYSKVQVQIKSEFISLEELLKSLKRKYFELINKK